MTDTRTPDQRRRIMKSVKTKNTGPELIVRDVLTRLGYRYRLHRRDLPGTPDVAFIARKKAIYVHGCFWHSHGCPKGQPPKSKREYWKPKLDANRARDQRNIADLEACGWSALVIWQCQLKDIAALEGSLIEFLGKPIFAEETKRD